MARCVRTDDLKETVPSPFSSASSLRARWSWSFQPPPCPLQFIAPRKTATQQPRTPTIHMNFLSSTSLFLFGLALPIVVLYILKLRRRREPVSTLMFWEQIFRERQTTSLFQKLKHLLSLLLQLLFLALLVLAIARPQSAFLTKSARQLILIIDHSASMNAVEDSDA